MLDRIEQDTIQLDSMLERILTVARLESGQYKPKFESALAERSTRRGARRCPLRSCRHRCHLNYQTTPIVSRQWRSQACCAARSRTSCATPFSIQDRGQHRHSRRASRRDKRFSRFATMAPGVPEEYPAAAVQGFLSRDDSRVTTDRRHGSGPGHRAQRCCRPWRHGVGKECRAPRP